MADNKTSILITAEDRASAALRSVQTSLGGLSTMATRIMPQLTALTGAFSVGSIAAFAKQAIDAADAINDMSTRTGLTVRNLAEWQLAIKQSDATMEGMSVGLRNLSIYMVDHGDKLRAAGITAKDVRGAFMQLADLFKAMPEGPERAALANEIFKKSGQELLPVMLQGSAALEVSAKKSREYADAMTDLAPKAAAFNDILDEIGVNLKSGAFSAINPYMDGLLKMAKTFNEATQSATGLKNMLAELQNLTGSGPLSVFGLASKGVDLAYLNGAGANEKGRGASGRIGGSSQMLPGQNTPDEIAAIARANEILAKEEDRKKNGRKTGSAKFTQSADFLAAQQVGLSGESGLSASEIMAQLHEADAAAAEYGDSLRKASESLYAATDAGKVDAMRKSMELAAEAFAAGYLSEDQLAAVEDSLTRTNDKLLETRDIGKDLGMTFTSAFEDAIIGGKQLSTVLDGLLKDIARLVMRQGVTEPLAKAIGGLDIGGFFKGLFTANALGGVYSGPGISSFSGQVVSQPTVFPFARGIGLMGEAGPEAILPLKRGSDGRLGIEGGTGNTTVNNVSVSVQAGGGQQTQGGGNLAALGEMIASATRAILVDEKRPGGLLA